MNTNKRLSSNQDDFRRELQKKFFRVVEQQVTSFLLDLADEPYQKILLAGLHEEEFWGLEGDLIDLFRERATPAVDAFANALIGWARRYHIETDWAMRDAFQLLSWWKDGSVPVGEDTRGMINVTVSPAYKWPVFRFEFTAPDLFFSDPENQGGIDFILKKLDEAYQERRESFKAGLLHQAEFRNAAEEKVFEDQDFVWLALYQCGKSSTIKIGSTKGADRNTVMSRSLKLADYLEIEFRQPGKGGRPGK